MSLIKKFKRILVLIMVCVLSCGTVLTSCNSNKKSNTSSSLSSGFSTQSSSSSSDNSSSSSSPCTSSSSSASITTSSSNSSSESSSITSSSSSASSSISSSSSTTPSFPSETPSVEGISTFDDGYVLGANWIWANTPEKQGQWVALRKTFTQTDDVVIATARISADTKYWLWINGELAVFEGQLKLGDSEETWYYDKIDITRYLVKGENTIAVQVFYSGKNSSSTIKTGVPAFLFDAEINGKRLYSDTSWKAILDPAYATPIDHINNRLGEPNIKYDATLQLTDDSGKSWTEKDYDDTSWGNAIIKDNDILNNTIYGVYWSKEGSGFDISDPRKNLVIRSVPNFTYEEVTKYTSSGTNAWTKTEGEYVFAPLSLPQTYTLEAVVEVCGPYAYSEGQPTGAAIGFCVCVADGNNFYMPQIAFNQSTIFDGVAYKPHLKQNGNWDWNVITTNDLTNTEIGQSLYKQGEYDYRYDTKHTVKIEVNASSISTYLNGTLLGTLNNTSLAREGSTIGVRQDINELIKIYSLKVLDANGQELFDANIDEQSVGSDLKSFSLLNSEYTGFISQYNHVENTSGENFVAFRNSLSAVNNEKSASAYKITNPTNLQGVPYLKVKSQTGGELISIKSDTWVNAYGSGETSIAHQYVTKAGEQTWEALGWINGHEITFTIPDTVEVLELGFRKSVYDTKATGSVTTDNAIINQLYQEAYDTLHVCMRDSFMDCPDRERCQWLGDAVINMQQAAFAMDENAALLYKKTLTQAIGFLISNGAIPTTIANGNGSLELPMQSLAGVHSFWQYYMYYGDKDLVVNAYPALLNYLKLWTISNTGVITHRGGGWDWMDWGEHYDTTIIENCWYYIALNAVLNIANLQGSGATASDIEYITNRMNLIKNNFDSLYWNTTKNAYYSWTDNGVADDRANALAIYAGLAPESRYSGILNVLNTTFNASPYMEKYVLESMYLIGADEDATQRTLKRFTLFTEDGYPTLPEIWLDQTLFGGDETKNHAWTGAPLSLLYMYNAGILPTSPAFKTISIMPRLGLLNSVSAVVERASGKISVEVQKTTDGYTLSVTVPEGVESALIGVPKTNNTTVTLGGVIIFENGAPIIENMPSGVSYEGENAEFVLFKVVAGNYDFVAK